MKRSPLKRKTGIRPISRKRRAYLASPDRAKGLAHMARVSRLPCLVCGAWPVEVHHVGKPRNDLHVAPLCPPHHRREFGPGAYHYSPRAFRAAHGDDQAILARVAAMLKNSC
jgi:hypothetical protein